MKTKCDYCSRSATRQVEAIHMCQSCYEYEMEQGLQAAEEQWSEERAYV